MLLSIAPSIVLRPLSCDKADGRLASLGLYIADGFVVDGGIEMLALATSPSRVSASAERPFRLAVDETVDGESKEWEVLRDLMCGGAGTVVIAESERGSEASRALPV